MPDQLPKNVILADQMHLNTSIHGKHVCAFYIALLLCTMKNKLHSETLNYDTLVYYFTCLQFDPTSLLCENSLLISKVAEKNIKVHSSGCSSGKVDWTGMLVNAFTLCVPTK